MNIGINGLFSATVIITLGATGGLITSTVVLARAYQYKYELPAKQEQSLAVTGSARKRIRSDLAEWRISVTADNKELTEAYKQMKLGGDKTLEFLKSRKFTDEEIKPGPIQTETNYKVEYRKGKDDELEKIVTREAESYTLTRSFVITTSRVDEVARPAGEVTELIESGIKISSGTPQYYYSKISDLKVEMIGEATKDARARADQITANAGYQVTEVRHARMGVLQITQPNSTDVSSSGIYDTSTIEKDVMAVVSLTLGLR